MEREHAQDPVSDALAGPYVGVKLAPTISKLRVLAVERRPSDSHFWYTLQIHPAPVSLPARPNTDNTSPTPVRLNIKKKPYTVYRRHEDVLEFARRLLAAFQNRRPVVLIDLPPLAQSHDIDHMLCFDNQEHSVHEYEEALGNVEYILMEQVDALIQKVARLPGALLQDKVIREFFGIWRSDLDYKLTRNLSDPIALTTAQRAVVVDPADGSHPPVATGMGKLQRVGTLPGLNHHLRSENLRASHISLLAQGSASKSDTSTSPVPVPSSISLELPQKMTVFHPPSPKSQQHDLSNTHNPSIPSIVDAKRTLSFGNFKPVIKRATTKFFNSRPKRGNELDLSMKSEPGLVLGQTQKQETSNTALSSDVASSVSSITRFPVMQPRTKRSGSLNGGGESSGSEMSGLEIVDTGFLDGLRLFSLDFYLFLEEGCPTWLRYAVETLEKAKNEQLVNDADPNHVLPTGKILRRQKTAPALSMRSSRTSTSVASSTPNDSEDGRRSAVGSEFGSRPGSRHARGISDATHDRDSMIIPAHNQTEDTLSDFPPILSPKHTPLLRSRSRSQHQLRPAAGPSPLSSTFNASDEARDLSDANAQEALNARITRLASSPAIFQPNASSLMSNSSMDSNLKIQEKQLIRQTSLARLKQRLEERQQGASSPESDSSQQTSTNTTESPSKSRKGSLKSLGLSELHINTKRSLFGRLSPKTSPIAVDPDTSLPLNLLPSQMPSLSSEQVSTSTRITQPTIARRPSIGRSLAKVGVATEKKLPDLPDEHLIKHHVDNIAPEPTEAVLSRAASIKHEKLLKQKAVAALDANVDLAIPETSKNPLSNTESILAGDHEDMVELKVVMDKNALIKLTISRSIDFPSLITQVKDKFKRCGYDEADLTDRCLVFRDSDRNVVRIDGDFALRVAMMGIGNANKVTLFYV